MTERRDVRVSGRLVFGPPVGHAELCCHPRLALPARGAPLGGAPAWVVVREEPAARGLIRREGVAVAAPPRLRSPEALLARVQEIADAFPAHRLSGWLECVDCAGGERWRVVVTDGKATEVRPVVTWPAA